MRGRLRALVARLHEPVDAASLAFFRVAFGLCAVGGVVRYLAYGWVRELYIDTPFRFTWALFPVSPWAGEGMIVHYAVMGLLGACIAAGFAWRLVMPAFFLMFTWVELLDKTNYLNHYVLFSLVAGALVFLPANRAGSLDVRLGWVRPSDTVPAWTVWLLRAQLGLVYFFAGVAKIDADWLLRGEPLATWLATRSDRPVLGPLLNLPGVPLAMSWGGFLFDLAVPFFLLDRRTRRWAYGVVLAFHAVTGALLNIGLFPLIMVSLTAIFFEPDWPRRVLGWPARTGSEEGWGRPRWLAPLLGLWLALQVAVPMRHLLVPGDVRWNMEGWRFSWRVMLVEKRGHFVFRVTDPKTGRTWKVRPEDTLNERQYHLASGSPDMILQLAHHVRDQAGGEVEVRVDAWASMNGGRSARLIDPDVDLAREPRNVLLPYPWVTPNPDPSAP